MVRRVEGADSEGGAASSAPVSGPLRGPWTDAALDQWRTVADEPADQAVAAYFAAAADAAPGSLMRSLVDHLDLPPEERVPAIADFLATSGRLPPWADPGRLDAGQDVFGNLIVHQFTALYLASLPSAYAAARGVHVIWLTARLEQDPVRRLNETAQFLMDVTAPGAFGLGGAAVDRILHVRLMHAAVRWLVDHQDGVSRPADADPAARPDRPTWAASWGRPVNQEDLAGTMLTFSTVVLDAFRRSGVELTTTSEEDFVHLWTVVGHLLGIRDELLPADLTAARELQVAIFTRQQEASVVGRDLTATLLGLLHDRVPRYVAGLAPAMSRKYVGDRVADMLGVPKSRVAKPILWLLVLFTRLTTRRDATVPSWISDRVGRRLMQGLLTASRAGARVPFAIPVSLGGVPDVVAVRKRLAATGGRPGPSPPASPPADRR
jgi:ER-bound oxygenase mpaB/B'/Rubber oxygenase, catalytic domain